MKKKKEEKPVKEKKTEKKTEEAKGSKRQKTMQCKVTLLDDAQFECELDVRDLPSYSMFSCVCVIAVTPVKHQFFSEDLKISLSHCLSVSLFTI